MDKYLLLVGFAAVGFAVWIGILKLWALYEKWTPPTVQTRLYTTAKNLPRDAFNLIFSCLVWASLGALLLRFVFGLVGLDVWLPSTSWAAPVVAFFIYCALLSFWDSPARSEPIQPRGRGLRRDGQKQTAPHTSRPATPPGNVRGRTIRSYHDIK